MYLAVTKLEGLTHPLIESAYLKRDRRGRTLIIETNFGDKNERGKKDALETLLVGLNDLISEVENNALHLDLIDIRMARPRHKELAAA